METQQTNVISSSSNVLYLEISFIYIYGFLNYRTIDFIHWICHHHQDQYE